MFKPRLPLSFSKFVSRNYYHQHFGEGKHRAKTCNNRINSMAYVKFPIHKGPTWELWPKPSHTLDSSDWDDDDDYNYISY